MSLTTDVKLKIHDVLHSVEFSAADFTELAPTQEVSRILARFEEQESIKRVGRIPGATRSLLTFRMDKGFVFRSAAAKRPKRENTESARAAVTVTPEQTESAMRLWRAMGLPDVAQVPRGRVHRSL